VEPAPKYIVEARGQGGGQEDCLYIYLLETADLGQLWPKGITRVQDHMAFIDHDPIQTVKGHLAV
jgi:hypothetical protein